MANKNHLEILGLGAQVWNKWRSDCSSVVPELEQAELSGTDLTSLDLSGARLFNADLSWADLTGSALSGADLESANLEGANLRQTDLRSVNLAGATLVQADLSGAVLEGSDFDGCLFGATRLVAVNLRGVRGLDTIGHIAPSSLGIDSVYFSRGEIPDVFLRGVGVGDDFIAAIRALAGGLQFYSCFISYSTQDQSFAERIYADLQAKGVRCWFAPHDVQGGKKLHEQIDQAIQMHERLLLILSPHSINSEWVKTEIAKARKREITEKRRMLFPVRLQLSFEKLQEWECFDADTGKDSAREIREYYIPDFSNWDDPKNYKEEFEKLIRDLKKAEDKPSAESASV